MTHHMLSFTSERTLLKYDTSEEDFFLLTTIQAPELDEEEGEDERQPIDLALVIDRSGSMSGPKITLVRQTLKFLVQEMKEFDRLGIVLFDTEIETFLPLTFCSGVNRLKIIEKIDTIRERGQTYLSGGLFTGLEMLRKRKPLPGRGGDPSVPSIHVDGFDVEAPRVASVLLLTDGEANVGMQQTAEILGLLRGTNSHPEIEEGGGGSLLSRHLRRKRRLRAQAKQAAAAAAAASSAGAAAPLKPGGGSTSRARSGPMWNYVNSGISLYTFGFGEEHNESMLKDIAQAAGGVYYFIENVESVADAFVDCLGGLLSVVCKDLRLFLRPEGGIRVKEVHTVYAKQSLDGGGVVVSLPDLQSEEKRDVLIQCAIPALPEQDVQWKALSVHLEYKDKAGVVSEEDLVGCIPRISEVPEAAATQVVNEVIDEQRNRVLAAQVAQEAQQLADEDRFEDAQQKVQTVLDRIEASAANQRNRTLTTGIVADLREQRSNLNRRQYRKKGRRHLAAVRQEWCFQRSAAPQSKSNAVMRNKKKRRMHSRKAAYLARNDEF